MLDWLYTAIAWVMKTWHTVFSTFLDPAGGITWALSIMFLVVTVRLILFPLFVKQIKSQRAMQELQPEIAKLRKEYGSDRQGLSQAMMALQKERGVNPLAGCLPLLPQIPVFLALFHVLRRLAPGKEGLYSWSDELTDQAAKADLFGAPISSQFFMSGDKLQLLDLPGVTQVGIRIVCFVLIVIMCITTFVTQKQIMKRSGPVEGQAAMIQKFLLYVMPASLFVSGFFFPIGVLLYWMTNNLWTLGQQYFVLRKMPPPGSPAALAKAAAERPAIDPKALAPKPGQKPVRPKAGKPTLAPESTVTVDGTPLDDGVERPSPAQSAPPNGAPAKKAPAKRTGAQRAEGTDGSTPAARKAPKKPTPPGTAPEPPAVQPSATGTPRDGASPPGAGNGTGAKPAGGSTAASRAKRKRR